MALPTKAAGWDPVGLQVGDPDAPVERLGVCHDVTSAVVAAAADRGVGLLVAYHPLLFRPTTSFVRGPSPAGLAHELAGAGIALVVVHTAFDIAPGGAAEALARHVGVESPRPFGPVWPSDSVKIVTFCPSDDADRVATAMGDAGAGSIGAYDHCSFRIEGEGTFWPSAEATPVVGEGGSFNRVDEIRVEMVAPTGAVDDVVAALVTAHPYEEPPYDVYDRRGDAGFVGRVGDLAATTSLGELAGAFEGAVRISGDEASPVRVVAVVPGSGGSLVGSAAAVRADVLVTGDVRHHDARLAERKGLAIVDPGHAATERPGVRALYAAVAAIDGEAVDLGDVDPDPWAR